MRKYCVNCRFFVPELHDSVQEGDMIRAGRCRKRSPSIGNFPLVMTHEWCGEHEIDVNKIEPPQTKKQTE